MTIEINPPMTEAEQPFLLSLRGHGKVTTQVIDASHVTIINPTTEASPFVFLVAQAIPPGVYAVLTTILRKLNP